MNKKHILPLLLFLCLPIIGQNHAEKIRQKLLDRDTSSVLVIAHRGDWRYAMENSLPAIDNAIKMGVDIVELDIQRTKDGELILMHDTKLDRTTTGKGRVDEWTLDSIKTLKLRNGCNIKTKEVVPSLEEALLHAKGKIMLNLDKADRYFDEVYALLKKTGTEKQIIMKGSKPYQEVKDKFGAYLDDIIYMPIVNLDKENAEEEIKTFVKELQPVAFELLYKKDSNPLHLKIVDILKGKSLIWYNTLWDTMAGGHDDDMALDDIDASYGYLINTAGARMLQTDRPGMLLDYLRGKGLHE